MAHEQAVQQGLASALSPALLLASAAAVDAALAHVPPLRLLRRRAGRLAGRPPLELLRARRGRQPLALLLLPVAEAARLLLLPRRGGPELAPLAAYTPAALAQGLGRNGAPTHPTVTEAINCGSI